MKHFTAFVCLLLLYGCASPNTRVVNLKLIQTSDIHGHYYAHDFIQQHDGGVGLARIACYVNEQRAQYGDNLLLLDNGDILQGEPAAYYYNYIDTSSEHVCAEMMNFMRYDAGNMGNHDIETGHAVFDRWSAQCDFPVLGANIIRISDGEPYFKPYAVFEREGIRIVVLGMITPAIPAWVQESLWEGLAFEDMETSARRWMQVIREKERPDIVIGLFHTGRIASTLMGKYREDASEEIARHVPGFDVILCGHDHLPYSGKVANAAGDSICVVNPGSNAMYLGDITLAVTLKNGKVVDKQIEGSLFDLSSTPVCPHFMEAFGPSYKAVENYVREKIGILEETLDMRAAYFGSSPIMDLIHTVQMEMTGADISFASPLSFEANIPKGDIRIKDMFDIYEFENFLYMMRLTGSEVKGVLEESYALWTNRMSSEHDHLLLFGKGESRYKNRRDLLANPYFLFDSAAGIVYTVDVTKPKGEKVNILRMSDGSPFNPAGTYKVVMPSYRGNGGGELLIKGAGVTQEVLKDRILFISEKDIRYYMINYIRKKRHLTPPVLGQWKFVPEQWAGCAAVRDYQYLFH